MRPRAAVLAVVVAGGVAAGPTGARAAPDPGARADQIMRAGAGRPSGGTRGYVAVPAEAFVASATGDISPIIFVNRCRGGCTFTKGAVSSSIHDITIIGGVAPGAVMRVSEFGWGDALWDATLACIREVYQPFGVEIVTDDPGQAPHHEAVLAGRGAEMGLTGVLGVAPLDGSTCQPKNDVISFSFANDHDPDPREMCWTLAQETAHAFGLDHEFECSDPMTYLPISQCGGQKFFRNLDAPCGEFAGRLCLCGAPTQDAFRKLLAVHGPGTVPVPAPTVAVVAPVDGATVPAGFTIDATAVDRRGLHHVELWINGWKWAEVPGVWQRQAPYTIALPAEVPDGVMDLEVRGCGDTGVCGTDALTVTRGAPCTDATTDCARGQQCAAGKCFWAPPTGALGDACTYPQACVSATCAEVDGASICTEPCKTGPLDRCPDGFACVASGAASGTAGLCGPIAPADEAGGCCAIGGQDRGGVVTDVALVGVVGLVIGRRRRRACAASHA